jgi:hypothetical protein
MVRAQSAGQLLEDSRQSAGQLRMEQALLLIS